MLLKLNLPYNGNPSPNTIFPDNSELPSLIFILGFCLDGCVIIKIRHVVESGALNFVPVFILTQKVTELNAHLFSMISSSLKAMQIPSRLSLRNTSDISDFKVEGINAFKKLLPLLTNYSHFWYFKSNQFALLVEFFKYYLAGVQKYRIGLIAILNVIYRYDNKRLKDLDHYINLVNIYFNHIDSDSASGNHFIQVTTGRGEQASVPIA